MYQKFRNAERNYMQKKINMYDLNFNALLVIFIKPALCHTIMLLLQTRNNVVKPEIFKVQVKVIFQIATNGV